MKNKKGFTLIELLIVVAIIGIIAAIAIPNLIRALQKGKQTRTIGDMKGIATNIETYRTECHFLPGGTTVQLGPVSSVYAAVPAFNIISGNQKVLFDGWGRPMYVAISAPSSSYSVGSAGKPLPNATGTVPPVWTELGSYTVIGMGDFCNDIIYANGAYVYSPKTQ